MPSKRKSDLSPQTKKAEIVTSKYRKNSKKAALPTGEVEEDYEDLMDAEESVEIPTQAIPITSAPIKIITFEVYKLNNSPFDGLICKDDRKNLWCLAGREISELQQISFKRLNNNCAQILYKLKIAKPVVELFKTDDFDLELKKEGQIETYSIRVPELGEVETELGKVVTVTAFKTIRVEADDVGEWLELYGKLQGDFR